MIFDKTKYRLQQLEKKLKAAHSGSAKARVQKSIDKYTKKGEEWHVKCNYSGPLGRGCGSRTVEQLW
jgi:hypothetical protein